MLSHGAIVAREYNIPAVLNVKNATSMLKDGPVVTVDGNKVRVSIRVDIVDLVQADPAIRQNVQKEGNFMERLTERLQDAHSALSRLNEVLSVETPSSIERDATIQRFEFTFEALWKAVKEYLYTMEGLDLASPKGVIRSCRELGILDEHEATLALVMSDDRNLTVHTYNESLAAQIYSRIKGYSFLMQDWLSELQRRVNRERGT